LKRIPLFFVLWRTAAYLMLCAFLFSALERAANLKPLQRGEI